MTLRRDGTDNLLDLYMEYVGKSEVPPQFHVWCCLSAVAAAVSNRVWLEKMPGKLLAPNLYVALIGPSALGKGEAIDAMLDVMRDQPRINIFKGKITAPALLDQLAVPGKGKHPPWSHLYLVTPELSWSMGKGDWADALVKQLTELYGGSVDAVRELTRTRGAVKIKAGELCINWVAGTVREWLVSSVPPDAISGGFFGRMVAVAGEYDFSVRYRRPIVPDDRLFLRAMLRSRLAGLGQLTGAFYMEPAAIAVEDKWYMERPAPSDPDLQAAWKRQHDLMLKLCMILALCDDSLVITPRIVAQAQRLSDNVVRKMPALIGFGNMSAETRGLGVAEDYLRRIPGPVPHSMLLKRMSSRGFDADSTRRVIQTLSEMGRIKTTGEWKKRSYEWTGGKSGMKLTLLPPPEAPGTNGHGPEPSGC